MKKHADWYNPLFYSVTPGCNRWLTSLPHTMNVNRRKRQRDSGEEDTGSAKPKVAPAFANKDLRDDERYKKSMYLAYVRDTLRKKAQVSPILWRTPQRLAH
jgi:hypothetical protein